MRNPQTLSFRKRFGIHILIAALMLALISTQAVAQFTTVLNIPDTDANIGDDQTILSDTQINLSEGGVIGQDFVAGDQNESSSNVEVNIMGGDVERRFYAYSETEINILSGSLGGAFRVYNSEVNLLEGNISGWFIASNTDVNVSGGEIGDNFIALNGTKVDFFGGSVGAGFSAGLPDGIDPDDIGLDEIVNQAEVNLHDGLLTDFSAYAGSTVDIYGGRVYSGSTYSGSDLNISGGNLNSLDVNQGSTASISGDTTLRDFDVLSGGVVNISGGEVGNADTHSDDVYGKLNISGGVVGDLLHARDGSEVNIMGGKVGSELRAYEGSEVNISGGIIGNEFRALSGSKVNISGGILGHDGRVYEGSEVVFYVSEFYLSGIPLEGLDEVGDSIEIEPATLLEYDDRLNLEYINRPRAYVLLADGSPFRIGEHPERGWQWFSGDTITLVKSESNLGEGKEYSIDTYQEQAGIVSRDIVHLKEGGYLPNGLNIGVGSILNIEGGKVGNFALAKGSVVNIVDGEVGFYFMGTYGTTINMSGGSVEGYLQVAHDSVVNITGGEIQTFSMAYSGSVINISDNAEVYSVDAQQGGTVNISGGDVGDAVGYDQGVMNISGGQVDYVYSYFGSEINISGGRVWHIADTIRTRDSTVNLIGTEFLLDGYDIEGLLNGATIVIDPSDYGSVTGRLADGTFYDSSNPRTVVPSLVTLTLTLLPSDFLAGDYNADGIVDAADYTVWRDAIGRDAGLLLNNFHSGIVGQSEYDTWLENYGAVLAEEIQMPGDYNDDGLVDAADYTVWRDSLGADAGTLPNDPHFGRIGQAQYDTWLENYGSTRSLSAESSSVPEPSTLLSVILAAANFIGRRRV